VISYWQFCAAYVHGRYGRTDRHTSFVEYALLVALLAIVCVAAVAFLNRASIHFNAVGWPT
jgi:pilus assembly protein Flp/PilA